ncbi:MAG: TetR/AcrR family transcriptional regulator, partial [Rhodanobacteraceae bacterium]
ATRDRIVDAAALRFRRDGIGAVGVASLMGEIGLTQGGFYNHFESKDDLAREVISESVAATRQLLEHAIAPDRPDALAAAIDYYLRAEHRDHPGNGCAAAALAVDIARGSPALKSAFTEEFRKTVALLAAMLPSSMKPKRRRETAQAVFASMMGTLVLARAVDDKALSDELLRAGRRAALAIAENSA